MNRILAVSISILFAINVFCQEGIPVTISVGFTYSNPPAGEWIHIKITDIQSNDVKYDQQFTLNAPNGLFETIYLRPGIYKCEIPDMGAYVNMPEIRINGGDVIPWGYPNYDYYRIVIVDQTTKIEMVGLSDSIIIYPNPFTNYVNVKSLYSIEKIDIYDTNGRKVYTAQNIKQKVERIDLKGLPGGIYFLKMSIDGVEGKYRIIKE